MGFLAVVFADPDNSSLTYAPSSSGDAREPDEDYECITDRDCWVMYNNYNCACATSWEYEYDINALIVCSIFQVLCPTCVYPCVIAPNWFACTWRVSGCAALLTTYCPGACPAYQNFCHYERVSIGR